MNDRRIEQRISAIVRRIAAQCKPMSASDRRERDQAAVSR
jgi:hypothetical protein